MILTEMVTTTSTSCTFHMYVRRVMYYRHTHIAMTAEIHIRCINAVGYLLENVQKIVVLLV